MIVINYKSSTINSCGVFRLDNAVFVRLFIVIDRDDCFCLRD